MNFNRSKKPYSLWKQLTILGLIVIALHSIVNIFLTIFTSSSSNLNNIQKSSSISIALKSLSKNEDGSIDLTLNINLNDLLAKLQEPYSNDKIHTPNPPPIIPGYYKANEKYCKIHHPILIIYVHSSPSNDVRRKTIRDTWGNNDLFTDNFTRLVFIIGLPDSTGIQKALDQEQKIHGDIVQGDFKESYKNLTLKSIFALRWLSEYCNNVTYALKADDDAFINIFELRKIIQQSTDQYLVACPLWKEHTMPILRDPKSCMKWCVKPNEFPGETHFPQYCAGIGFLFTTNLASKMVENALKIPFFWIDDVYTTGLLLKGVDDVKYIDYLSKFTLKEKLALPSYKKADETPDHFFVHIRIKDNMYKFFKLAIKQSGKSFVDKISKKFLNFTSN